MALVTWKFPGKDNLLLKLTLNTIRVEITVSKYYDKIKALSIATECQVFCLREACLLHAIHQCYLNNILTAQDSRLYWRVFTETEWDMLITQTGCEVFVIPSMSDLLDSARLPCVTQSELSAHGCV